MLEQNNKNIVYLISGPVGVGKSTISKKVVQKIENGILIEGDLILDMFDYSSTSVSWEERLRITWENILNLTTNFIQNGFNVVIDFVVENELEWFSKQLFDFNVTLKYIVLKADKEKLIERINNRGDLDSIERSLFLLDQLVSTSSNYPFLLDTTLSEIEDIVDNIINDKGFIVKALFS